MSRLLIPLRKVVGGSGWRFAAVLALALAAVAALLLILIPASAPFVLVFVALLGATTWQIARGWRHLSAHRIVQSALLLVCLGALAVPAAIGMAQGFVVASEALIAVGSGELWLAVLGCGGVAVAALAVARVWPGRIADRWFLLVFGLAFLSLKLLYVGLVEMTPVSDFGRMWGMAGRIVEEGGDALPVAPRFTARVYFERIVLYLLPLRALFGPENSSYEVPNVLVGLAASLVTFALARSWFGRAAARIAFLLANLAPETWLASAIPTHDIPGALTAMLALGSFVLLARALLQRRPRQALTLSAVAGALLIVVDLQRTIGFLVFAASAIGVLVALYGRPRAQGDLSIRALLFHLLLVIGLPGGIFLGGMELLERADLTVPDEVMEQHTLLVTAAHTDSWGSGRYPHYRDEWAANYGGTGLLSRELVLRKWLSDARYSPLERLPNAARKSAALYSLGSQVTFYLKGAQIGDEVAVPATLRRISALNALFVAAFLASFVFALVLLWHRGRPRLITLLPLLYLSMLSAALILVGEVQPRYLYQTWYIAPIYIGFLLGGNRPGAPAAISSELRDRDE